MLQIDKWEGSPLGGTLVPKGSPTVRFELLRVIGNRRIRRKVHGANKRSGGVDTSVSDLPRRMCSRHQATTCPERYSTYAFANDCGNCCRYVNTSQEFLRIPNNASVSLRSLIWRPIPYKLQAAFPVDYMYAESFAEFVRTLPVRLFLLAFVIIAFSQIQRIFDKFVHGVD